MAESEVKGERDASAPRGGAQYEDFVIEAAKEFESFDALWRVCMEEQEREGEISDTHEMIAEYRGWLPQLCRLKRSDESKAAQKRGRSSTAGEWHVTDSQEVQSAKLEDSDAFGFKGNPAWKHPVVPPGSTCEAPPLRQAAKAAASEAFAAAKTDTDAEMPSAERKSQGRKSEAAEDFKDKMRTQKATAAAEPPAEKTVPPRRVTPDGLNSTGASSSQSGQAVLEAEGNEVDEGRMQQKMKHTLKLLGDSAVTKEAALQGVDLIDEKIAAVAASIAVQLNRNIARTSKLVIETQQAQKTASIATQSVTKIIDVVGKTEAWHATINIVKKKGCSTEDFKRYCWPVVMRRCRAADVSDKISEGNLLGGAARLVARWGTEAKTISNTVFAAIRDENYQQYCSVFTGKPDMKRASEEQQNGLYRAIETHLSIRTPQQKQAAQLRTKWPHERNGGTFAFFFAEDNKPIQVLGAGRINTKDLTVNIWIYDDDLLREFYNQLEKMGGPTRCYTQQSTSRQPYDASRIYRSSHRPQRNSRR